MFLQIFAIESWFVTNAVETSTSSWVNSFFCCVVVGCFLWKFWIAHFLIFLLAHFAHILLSLLSCDTLTPTHLPVSSHHHRITCTDGSDLLWMVQQEPHRPPHASDPTQEVFVQASRHVLLQPENWAETRRHTAHMLRCRACTRTPSPSPKSHTCVPSHLCHFVVSLHPDMIHTRLIVWLVSFCVCHVCGWN